MAKSKNKKKKFWIGIDLGGTKLLTTVMNNNFHILAAVKNKVEASRGAKHFMKMLEESVREVLKEAHIDKEKVGGIGIGAPGIINKKKGEIEFCPNIPFLNHCKLASALSKKVKIPVVLENDANTGLFGEAELGAARGYADVIGIFVGTGVGGGILIDGKIYRGASGAAGEIGHMVVDDSGPQCGCGQNGCLEAYAGRLAIAGDAAVLASRRQAKALYEEAGTEVAKIKSGVIAKAIAKGDRALQNLVRERAVVLGKAMANLANAMSPELFVLGGGMIEAMPFIVKEAEKAMRGQVMERIGAHVKVVPAKLGDHAIVKGAARLAELAFGKKAKS